MIENMSVFNGNLQILPVCIWTGYASLNIIKRNIWNKKKKWLHSITATYLLAKGYNPDPSSPYLQIKTTFVTLMMLYHLLVYKIHAHSDYIILDQWQHLNSRVWMCKIVLSSLYKFCQAGTKLSVEIPTFSRKKPCQELSVSWYWTLRSSLHIVICCGVIHFLHLHVITIKALCNMMQPVTVETNGNHYIVDPKFNLNPPSVKKSGIDRNPWLAKILQQTQCFCKHISIDIQ